MEKNLLKSEIAGSEKKSEIEISTALLSERLLDAQQAQLRGVSGLG